MFTNNHEHSSPNSRGNPSRVNNWASAISFPPSYLDSKIIYLSKWQVMQRTLQQFWQSEYLTRLQQRPKWPVGTKNIKLMIWY